MYFLYFVPFVFFGFVLFNLFIMDNPNISHSYMTYLMEMEKDEGRRMLRGEEEDITQSQNEI